MEKFNAQSIVVGCERVAEKGKPGEVCIPLARARLRVDLMTEALRHALEEAGSSESCALAP